MGVIYIVDGSDIYSRRVLYMIMSYMIMHRCMIMSYDTLPSIDAWSFCMIHNLPSIYTKSYIVVVMNV